MVPISKFRVVCVSLVFLVIGGLGTTVRAADGSAEVVLQLPERLMMGPEVIREIGRQTGWRYAYPAGALVRQLDVSDYKGQARMMDLVSKLADRVTVTQGVIVLEADIPASLLAELGALLKSEKTDDRRVAAYRLGCSRSTLALEPLVAALDDKDESVRHHALRSLVRLEKDFRTYAPRGRVSIFSIKRALTADRIQKLLKAAGEETSNEWLWAAELLGRNPAGGDAAAMLGQGKSDYVGVRKMREWVQAEFKAARMGPEAISIVSRSIPPRVEQLKLQAAEKDPARRAERLLELGRVGGIEVWDLLIRELGNADPVIRQAAIQALRRCPDARVVAPLMNLLTGKDMDKDDRSLAAMTLGLIGSDDVVKALSDYVFASKGAIISGTGLALGYTGDRRAVPALIRCANDKSDSLKGYAFTALALLGTREAVDTLMGVYNQEDNVSRYMGHAAVRLAGAWHQEAVDRYVEKTKSGGKIAPHGLEMAEDPRAVDALLDRLPTSSKERRLWVVQALGRIGDPKAVPGLIKALGEGDSNEQYQAMRALRWRWFWHRADVQAALKQHPVFKAFVGPAPDFAAQPENTWVLRKWAVDIDDDRMSATTYEAGLEFDGSTGRIFKWGSHGTRCDSPQTGDTWLYDPLANTWKESASPVHPFGMCGTWGTTYDRANRCIVSLQLEGANHGWQWDRARTLRPASPWVYFGDKDTWVPMKPQEPEQGPGLRGFLPLVYHDRAQVMVLHGGQGGNLRSGTMADRVWTYDAYVNTWTMLPAAPLMAGARAHQGMCYLPDQNRVLLVGGSYGKADKRTWLYDLENNTWAEANSKGDVPQLRLPVVFDPVSRTALKFADSAHGVAVWQYDPVANEWKKVPDPSGPSPHYDSAHTTYDPAHNVYFMAGGHLGWATDHIGVSEVWTYKFKNRPEGAKAGDRPVPVGVSVNTQLEGGARRAKVSWPAVQGVKGYAVYRGTGEAAWTLKWEKTGAVSGPETLFMDKAPPDGTGVLYYTVAAIGAEGREGERSLFCRTQPAFPMGLVVSVMMDRTVKVKWAPAVAADVVGYNVYSSTVEVGDFHFKSVFKRIQPLAKLTEKVLTVCEFTDQRPLMKAEKFFDHEVRAYEVRAVNAWGVESGPSATVLTLASSVPHVTAEELADGTTRIQWAASPEEGVTGYRVYRMDEYRPSVAVQLNPVPVKGLNFVDEPEFPRVERRRYYVVAVDGLGQEGLPSTGAWSFGRP